MTDSVVEITGLTHEGRGIGRIEGKTLFVEGALPGETVQFQMIKKHRHFDEARMTACLSPSPERITPRCPHFGVCGGCSQQYFSHALQIQNKQTILLESLLHTAKVQPKKLLEPILGPIWAYRHKARLGVKYVIKKEKVLVGFREKQGRYLADLNTCDVLHPSVGHLLRPLSDCIAGLEAYRHIAQIEVAVAENATALVFRHLMPMSESDLEKLCAFGNAHQLRLYLQSGGVETVVGLYPSVSLDPLYYRLPQFDLTLYFEPLDFTQVNPVINEKLVSRAIELLELNADDRVMDYFCGIGNFTLAMAKLAGSVVGVEGSETAIARARENALRNGLSNVQFYTENLMGDVSCVPWKSDYSKILLDPPRSGAIELITQSVFHAKRLVYVSCNPSTLARDAAVLIEKQGYRLEAAGILDMFPHTSHVESIALFTKK